MSSLSRDQTADGGWSSGSAVPAASTGSAAILVPFAVGRGSLVSIFEDRRLHFTYHDAGPRLQDAWLRVRRVEPAAAPRMARPRSSREYVVPTPGPMPAPGTPFVSVYDDQRPVTCRDGNGDVQDAWRDTSWLASTADQPRRRARAPPHAAVEQTVRLRARRQTPVSPTSTPTAGSRDVLVRRRRTWRLERDKRRRRQPARIERPLFVSYYDDQQHSTCSNSNSSVQDASAGCKRAGISHGGSPRQQQKSHRTSRNSAALIFSAHDDDARFAYLDAHSRIQRRLVSTATDSHLQQDERRRRRAARRRPPYSSFRSATIGGGSPPTRRTATATCGRSLSRCPALASTAVRPRPTARTPRHAAVDRLFVSAHDDEHHFRLPRRPRQSPDVTEGTATTGACSSLDAGASVTVSGGDCPPPAAPPLRGSRAPGR